MEFLLSAPFLLIFSGHIEQSGALFNKINFNTPFSVRKDSFRLQININLNVHLKAFLEKFPKFDIKYTAFYRKRKRKKWKNPVGTK